MIFSKTAIFVTAQYCLRLSLVFYVFSVARWLRKIVLLIFANFAKYFKPTHKLIDLPKCPIDSAVTIRRPVWRYRFYYCYFSYHLIHVYLSRNRRLMIVVNGQATVYKPIYAWAATLHA